MDAVQTTRFRQRAYPGDRPPPDVAGCTLILVDDGLATGSTMRAAVEALKEDEPALGRTSEWEAGELPETYPWGV